MIAKIVDKAKSADIGTLNKLMDEVFPKISTNISKSEILSMGMSMLSYKIGETTGFPFWHRTSEDGSYNEVPVTLEKNVDQLHIFLFGDEDYEPSEDVVERSNYIIERTGFSEDTAVSDENYQSSGDELTTEKENESESDSQEQ